MSNFVDCQKVLLATARNQGYLTFDDILDAASASSLSTSEIDRLSENLQSQGVMLLETAPANISEENKELSDYSRSDYDEIFTEILSLSEAAAPLIEIVKEIPPPQYGEIQTLTEQLHFSNEFARERLILLHLRVAIKIALSISKQYSYPIDDAISAAMIGLVEAVEHFDPNGFSAFLSYASMWIQQNIHRFCTPVWMEYYCPTHIREKMFPVLLKYNSNSGTLIQDNEYDWCSIWEIADELDIEDTEVRKHLTFAYTQANGRINSDVLWHPTDTHEEPMPEEIEISSLICETDLNELAAAKELSQIIPAVINTLTPREQEIIRMRFGFYDGNPKTLEEVGLRFNVTRERIRQLETKSIRKLRHPSRSKRLKDFY